MICLLHLSLDPKILLGFHSSFFPLEGCKDGGVGLSLVHSSRAIVGS